MADILTTERLTFKFRLLALLAVGMSFVFAGAGGDAGSFVLLIVVYLIYAIALHSLPPSWSRPGLVYPMILVDAIFLGLLQYLSGDASSLVMVLYNGASGLRRIITVRGSGYMLVPVTTRTAGGEEQ